MSTPSPAEVEKRSDRVHGSGFSARIYDPFLWFGEKTGLSERRRRLLEAARGDVLEVGAGTGLNLAHYPDGLGRLVLSEPEPHMADLLLKRSAELGMDAEYARATAEALPFADDSFDTVVATLVFCTVGEPDVAIAELKRVLRPDGQILFMEHIRSERRGVARIQDSLERPWARLADGCRCNRRTIETMVAGGFEVDIRSVADKALMPPMARPIVSGVARPILR